MNHIPHNMSVNSTTNIYNHYYNDIFKINPGEHNELKQLFLYIHVYAVVYASQLNYSNKQPQTLSTIPQPLLFYKAQLI